MAPGSGPTRHFVTLGMFIIDQFEFLDDDGKATGKTLEPQVLRQSNFRAFEELNS